MARQTLTAGKVRKIVGLVKSKLTLREVSEQLSVCITTVRKYMRLMGMPTRRPSTFPLTPEQEQRVRKLHEQGASRKAIAEELGLHQSQLKKVESQLQLWRDLNGPRRITDKQLRSEFAYDRFRDGMTTRELMVKYKCGSGTIKRAVKRLNLLAKQQKIVLPTPMDRTVLFDDGSYTTLSTALHQMRRKGMSRRAMSEELSISKRRLATLMKRLDLKANPPNYPKKPPPFTREELAELVATNTPLRKIAMKFGCRPERVRSFIRLWAIPPPIITNRAIYPEELMCDFYDAIFLEGKSIKEIEIDFGVSRYAVRRAKRDVLALLARGVKPGTKLFAMEQRHAE